MSNRKKVGNILILFGLLLIAAAVVMYGVGLHREKLADQSGEDLSVQLVQAIAEKAKEVPAEAAPAESENGNATIADGDMFTVADTLHETTLSVAHYDFIGYLSIPALRLDIPVLADWNDRLLEVAPCRYAGSPENNDLVISGHNYSRHFGRLSRLSAGDTVTLTRTDGSVIRYEVSISEILLPTEITRMIDSRYDLTLFTCTKGGRTRYALRCTRIGETQAGE